MNYLLAAAVFLSLVAVGFSQRICPGEPWCEGSDGAAAGPVGSGPSLNRCCKKLQECKVPKCGSQWHEVCARRFCGCLGKIEGSSDVVDCADFFFKRGATPMGYPGFRYDNKIHTCSDIRTKLTECDVGI